MFKKLNLRTRVIMTMLTLTLTVSGVFSLGIVGVFTYIEKTLVTKDMSHKIVVLAKHGTASVDAIATNGINLYSENDIPSTLKEVPYGFSEIVKNNDAFYVYKQNIDNVDYVLTQDQIEFEAYENNLWLSVVFGFVLSLIAAAIVGWGLSRQLIEPIVRLANQVSDPNKPLLSEYEINKYTNDEIGQLAYAFSSAMIEVDSALQRERLFTSDVSHELRTSLMVISSATELLLADKDSSSSEAQHLDRILRASQEMSTLVQTFLILARASKGEAEISVHKTLENIASNQINQWSEAFQQKGVVLELEKPNFSSHKTYNNTFLDSIIFNLLRNALQYTDAGFVKLQVGDGWFTVKDTGIGIPSLKQDNIFQPFVRGDHPLIEGFGLGLSLVKRICDHQGWSVSFLSSPDDGTEFKVTLS